MAGLWCSNCGQKWAPLDPTWHDVLHDGIHELVDVDGKFVRTVRTLFLAPGALTAEFLRGRRARQTPPFRLYLILSALFFLLTAMVPNPNPDQEGASGTDSSAERVIERYVEERLSSVTPKLFFVLVPVFALLLKVAYRRERRHYP
jgi:hypothetical protein